MNADPEIYALLGIAAFERLGPGNYRAVGEPPEWWRGLTSSWTKSFSIPFVEDYLADAEVFWESGQAGLANSEVFQAESEGVAVTLDVVAANTSSAHYLLIRNLDIGGVGVTNVLQTARENQLRFNKEIDEHVELQVDLSRAKEAAELLSQAKTQFLANVSHEIRTPLTAVLGMADLLADTQLDEEQQSFVETIQESSDHLLRIINDLLDFSRVESGQFELESIPIDIRSFASQTRSRFISRAKVKGLLFDVSVGDEVPKMIQSDPVRLAQITDNLICNALKFTSDGHIRAQFEVNPKDRTELLLLIADSGIGISPEKQEFIFQSFVQEDASTTRRFGGTGLGLAIVRQLASVMGGDVTLESRPGEGTTFFVSLPIELNTELTSEPTDAPDAPVDILLDDNTPLDDEIEADEIESDEQPHKDDAPTGLALETATLLASIDWDDEEKEEEATRKNAASSTTDDTATVANDWSRSDSGSDWFGSQQKNTSSDWYNKGPNDTPEDSAAEPIDLDNDHPDEPTNQLDELDGFGDLGERNPQAPKPRQDERNLIEDCQSEPHRDDAPVESQQARQETPPDEPEWEPPNLRERSTPSTTQAKDHFDDEPMESFVPRPRDRATPSTSNSFRKPKNIECLRVLLAEDNAAIQVLLTRMLKKAGHTAVTANNGKQAVEKMDQDIDLVLMDCQMPILDGFEATRAIRDWETENNRPRVPIIALTAHAMAGFREKCVAKGMDEYLTKPLNQSDLELVIEKTIGAQAQPF